MSQRTALYAIEHVATGRLYVGISKDPKARWREHLRPNPSLISRALQKYGRDAFAFHIVEWFDSREQACAAEVDAIAAGFGHFNLAAGGDDGGRGLSAQCPIGHDLTAPGARCRVRKSTPNGECLECYRARLCTRRLYRVWINANRDPRLGLIRALPQQQTPRRKTMSRPEVKAKISASKARTHCPKGHDLTIPNAKLCDGKCKVCRNVWQNERRKRRGRGERAPRIY